VRIDDPYENPIVQILERLDALEKQNPLQNAGVARGRTRYYAGSQLLIEDSNLDVTGTATIIGWLRVIGSILLEGLGILTVNGLIDLLGRMRVRGGGGVTVEDGGDIVVEGGEIKAGDVVIRDGKVYVGDMVLDPDEHGGAIIFPNGAQVFTDLETIQVFKGNSVMQISDDYARLQHGGDVVEIDGSGVRISPAAVGIAAEGETVAPLGINSAGRLRRVPSKEAAA